MGSPSEPEPGPSEPSVLESALPSEPSLLRGKPPSRGQFREATVVSGSNALAYAAAAVMALVLALALRG